MQPRNLNNAPGCECRAANFNLAAFFIFQRKTSQACYRFGDYSAVLVTNQ